MILKSPNGATCAKLTISNAGVLVTTDNCLPITKRCAHVQLKTSGLYFIPFLLGRGTRGRVLAASNPSRFAPPEREGNKLGMDEKTNS